jgi:biotin-[acetyl-CoA-carboxylase] ligase BirA-like protein
MIVYADDIEFAEKVLPPKPDWKKTSLSDMDEGILPVTAKLFSPGSFLHTCSLKENDWKYLLIVKHTSESQFDLLIDLGRKLDHLPDGILCLAESGNKMHGFRNRPWISVGGNIHLSAFFSPYRTVPFFQVGFTILSAVSVVQTIDSLGTLPNRASIKWINDVLIDNSKVSGVIAHTITRGSHVTGAILGIGINVETTPEVNRDPFVPGVISLRDVFPDRDQCNQYLVLNRLIAFLQENYQKLIQGNYPQLLDFYRKRSIIVGKNVTIYTDPIEGDPEEMSRGKVRAIGEFLELYLDGSASPVTRGRLLVE